MADSKPKPPSIPSWQQANAKSNDSTSTSTSTSTSSPTSDEPSRSTLVEQAAKFLQDDSIQDEINTLLGLSPTPEETTSTTEDAKTASPDSTSTSTDSASPTSSTLQASPQPSFSSSTTSAPESAPAATASSSTPTPTSTPKTNTTRDMPPIITYPEFLTTPTQPPPLVTLRSVLYTLYGAAGLSASLYGASEFLIKPMLANLTSARQELASTATLNLQRLNEKLEKTVSLFHRDIATQTTTSDFAPTTSIPSLPSTQDTQASTPTAKVLAHTTRLESITSQLRDFSSTEKDSSAFDDSLRTRLNELHHYLDGLIYAKAGFNPLAGYGAYSTPGIESGGGAATGVGKGEEDAIAGFRAEIRGVKGAMLSARNFPAGRGGRVGGGLVRE
ncbi:hypothetical protein BO70DRAFT_412751 [Aspergillus heteromorphus CBS 117.55]|uniref:Uncharacterized protein n=1 Tax=Aspergillus heteromorphus CBS 117.55 TaxID=1448321 RepID=A0A317VJ58_9EURO|nr:uncharacterized protein BO70DRAFT_412751 [Aspergillus heteromorphus CBS 117.55]PWY74404.1 hypothetical protein BO70DRAFT_412751 [Aspergillus heteromorphus CBS 117.55]